MKPARILVVEDNPSHLKLAHPVLSAAGYSVNDAEGAEQAVSAIKADKPELILLDIELPGMDGLTLVKKLKADPETRDILMNLLGNAFKFTSKKDGAQIQFSKTSSTADAAFLVRDNGAGFDMAYADKLFGAFQRLHNQNEFKGTGIGLATVQRIIHRHNGKTWAESAPGKGATFFFTLGGTLPKPNEPQNNPQNGSA